MPARKAYPSTRRAGFKPKYRRKPPKRKRRVIKMLKPMAEVHTHEVESANVYPLANLAQPSFAPSTDGKTFRRQACNVFIPTAFTHFFNGGTDITGESLFAKYLQMKLRISFPQGTQILVPNQTLYLIHGYCDPTKLTYDDFKLNMSNTRSAESPPKDLIDGAYIPWHVSRLIHEEFNSEADQMSWVGKKQRRGYSLLGYSKITVDKDTAITSRTHLGAVQTGIGEQQGGPPQILRRITWPMNRKVQYTLSTISPPGAGNPGQDQWFKYPNDNSIPFVALFNPQWQKQGVDNRPESGLGTIQVEMSSKLWYNDF